MKRVGLRVGCLPALRQLWRQRQVLVLHRGAACHSQQAVVGPAQDLAERLPPRRRVQVLGVDPVGDVELPARPRFSSLDQPRRFTLALAGATGGKQRHCAGGCRRQNAASPELLHAYLPPVRTIQSRRRRTERPRPSRRPRRAPRRPDMSQATSTRLLARPESSGSRPDCRRPAPTPCSRQPRLPRFESYQRTKAARRTGR